MFHKDKSGLVHFRYGAGGDAMSAALECIERCDPDAPLWFWFNGTFCPVDDNDTARDVVDRWSQWRELFQKNPQYILTLLDEWSSANV